MFRSRANSQHIAKPPTNVNGTSTGLGQCNKAKITLANNAATIGRFHRIQQSVHQIRIQRDLAATSKTKSNRKIDANPKNEQAIGEPLLDTVRAAPSAAMQIPKTTAACRAAGRKLSARQPRVFGVSRCRTKLATSQTGHHPRAWMSELQPPNVPGK